MCRHNKNIVAAVDHEPRLEATTFTAKSSAPGLPEQPANPRRTSRIVSPVMSVLEREANAISLPDGLALPDRDATRGKRQDFSLQHRANRSNEDEHGVWHRTFSGSLGRTQSERWLREPTGDGGPGWGVAGSFSIELQTLHAVHHLSYLVSHSIARAFR